MSDDACSSSLFASRSLCVCVSAAGRRKIVFRKFSKWVWCTWKRYGISIGVLPVARIHHDSGKLNSTLLVMLLSLNIARVPGLALSLSIYILCLPALCKVNLICGVAIKFFAFPSAVSGFRALRCHFSLFDSRIRFSCAHCTLHTATVCVWALYPCMHRDGECKSGDCACVRVAHGSIRMWSKPKPWGKN